MENNGSAYVGPDFFHGSIDKQESREYNYLCKRLHKP